MSQLLGVVMCGGESRRMGTDKGMMRLGDITWAQLAYNKLWQLLIPVVASVNAIQLEAYKII